MSLRKVAIIFDNEVRPDTTGGYCRRALGQLVEVEHFLPSELGKIPRDRFDLYLNIDDGLDYRLPADFHPCAWWAIDTHLNLDWCKHKAEDFDFVFAAQRDGAKQLRQAGTANCEWLPLACDPEIHAKQEIAKRFDVCFVGNLFPGPRTELVSCLQKEFPNSFVGRCFFEEMARTYSESKIVFNRSILNDINMRVFEALAAGSLLLTNDLTDNGQAVLFQDGVHLATYRDQEEMLDKVRYYLTHAHARERIAAAGRAAVLAKDTYRQRMEKILVTVERALAKCSTPVMFPATADQPLFVTAGECNGSETASNHGRTSIIILTHNQLSVTKLCLESIARNTPEPHEVIVVDNASTDCTVEYLQGLEWVQVVRNAENRGFPAAANQGIRAAKGDFVLLLNNDTVVPPGWLKRLLAAFERDARIGLVGPCCNCVSGAQQVAVTYADITDLDRFARDWAGGKEDLLEDTDRLIGFCLLIRRAVVDKIGLLDEQFGVGCFEDDDYCLRALRAGYRVVIARAAFIHHWGGQTFRNSGVDFEALMQENLQRFRAKWSGTTGLARPSTDSQKPKAPVANGALMLQRAPGGGLKLVAKDLVLSLCMIVRDNEKTIVPCLESIRPWVDEMIVVDTGSKDKTPEIARQLGARVYHFPWCDSFSAARNESLRHARGRWLFWMDSDDTIDEKNGRKLRALARRETDPSLLGYIVQVYCPGDNDDGDFTVVDHVKLFRNRPELRFDRRIHEQIIPAIRQAGGELAWTDLFVVHSGSDHSPEGKARKVERDLRLLQLELKEQPDHPFTLFNLGMTYAEVGRYVEAVEFLQRSLKHSQPGESHLRKAYALLVGAFSQANRPDDAWQTCETGLKLFPLDDELRFRKGALLHEQGRGREAVAAYLDLLERHEERHFTSVVQGIAGFMARHNLAAVYTELDEFAQAEKQLRLAIQDRPRYRPAWRGLGDLLLRQRKLKEAKTMIECMATDPHLKSEALVLKAQLAEANGDQNAARHLFEQGAKEYPDRTEPLQALCRYLFEHNQPEAAAQALQELIRRDPKDSSACHNLGMVHFRLGRYREAVAAYRQALEHRPRSASIYCQLGHALKHDGQLEAAVAAWHETLRLAPGDPEATEALAQARP